MDLSTIKNTANWGSSAANLNENFTKVGTEVDKLKYAAYNSKLYATEALLKQSVPSPKVGDWAIVGDTIPGEIYQCKTDGVWTATGQTGGGYGMEVVEKNVTEQHITEVHNEYTGDIVNNPDDEDLYSEEVSEGKSVLKLADKVYNASSFSGMGRAYLRKNITGGKNVLTQAMVGSANTRYIIQYDYDLNGETINLPENSYLIFEGGSLKNGVLNGNQSRIFSGLQPIFYNITFKGHWHVKDCYPEWFDYYTSNESYKSIQNAIDAALSIGSRVCISREYDIYSSINIDRIVDGAFNDLFVLHGGGRLNAKNSTSIFSSSIEYSGLPNTQWCVFKDLIFDGDDDCYVFDGNRILRSISISCTYHIKLLYSDSYIQSLYFSSCMMRDFIGSWLKVTGGAYDIKINQCLFDRANAGVAIDMHQGSSHKLSNISITSCLFENLLTAISYDGASSFNVLDSYFEYNTNGSIVCSGSNENYSVKISGNFFFGEGDDNTSGNGYYHVIWGKCYNGVAENNTCQQKLHYLRYGQIEIRINEPILSSRSQICNKVWKLAKIWHGDKLPKSDGSVVGYCIDIRVGDIILNTDFTANKNLGWVCVTSGDYNTAGWESFGNVTHEFYYLDGTENLNDVKERGIYTPPSGSISSFKISGQNWPTDKAGILEVKSRTSNMPEYAVQVYRSIDEQGSACDVYERTYYGYGGRWGAWSKLN